MSFLDLRSRRTHGISSLKFSRRVPIHWTFSKSYDQLILKRSITRHVLVVPKIFVFSIYWILKETFKIIYVIINWRPPQGSCKLLQWNQTFFLQIFEPVVFIEQSLMDRICSIKATGPNICKTSVCFCFILHCVLNVTVWRTPSPQAPALFCTSDFIQEEWTPRHRLHKDNLFFIS